LAEEIRDLEPTSSKVHIDRLTIKDASALPMTIQRRISAKVKAGDYRGEDWLDQVSEGIREAWQQYGYFKALAKAEAKELLWRSDGNHFAVVVRIEEGARYRVKDITFTGGTVFPTARLRSLFPINDGDVFRTSRVRQGIKELHRVYGGQGYVNFTPVPDTEINDEDRTIRLKFELDEGKRFWLASVNVLGLAPRERHKVEKFWEQQIGMPYSSDLVERFFIRNHSLLPRDASPVIDTGVDWDLARGLLSLTFDFRRPRCPDWSEIGIDIRKTHPQLFESAPH
jgi:outer membrane translocation and assembly module TamA